MLPIILTCTPNGDGQAVLVVSVRAGRRVQIVIPDPGLFGPPDADTIAELVQLTERKGTL